MPETDVGVPGVVAGVTFDDADVYEPVPTAFTAATRNTYAVPFDNPVTVADAVVEVPSANVVHDTPELDEYWIT